MKNYKDVSRLLKKYAMVALLFPLRLFPIKKNRIMLINGLSLKYAGNPKAIGEYLTQKWPYEFQIFLAVKDPKQYQSLLCKGIRPVRYLSLAYFFYSLTAKVFISNSGGYSFLPMRKSQLVVCTWHGGGAYKKGGLDVCNTAAYQKDIYLMSKKTSLMLSSCSQQTAIFESSFRIPREHIWETGMPRNDMLLTINATQRAKIREKIGLKSGEKLVLYAPTFRKENDDQLGRMVSGNYSIDARSVCDALSSRFGGSWIFAYRLHPLIATRNLPQFQDSINLSDYEDMQDLLLVADVLINDYSSSMWDYSFTGKPCFIFAPDLDHYSETTDLYTPVSEWPFPLAQSSEELMDKILSFDEKSYTEKIAAHHKILGSVEKGIATQMICEKIHNICS
jgi:CDP-glycerol glycerophosphotransferase